jgi:hypothetical protein
MCEVWDVGFESLSFHVMCFCDVCWAIVVCLEFCGVVGRYYWLFGAAGGRVWVCTPVRCWSLRTYVAMCVIFCAIIRGCSIYCRWPFGSSDVRFTSDLSRCVFGRVLWLL